MLEKVRKKTVQDFDDQWKLQGELNEDYWASDEILFDQFANLFSANEVKDKVVTTIQNIHTQNRSLLKQYL